jgi:putative SOS response-associated peptidase YedK
MSVILGSHDYTRWLDTSVREFAEVEDLLQPYAIMIAHPVSKRVGNANQNDAKLMTAAS